MTTPRWKPGWYPDPDDTGGTRYWHGSGWSESRRSRSTVDSRPRAVGPDRIRPQRLAGRTPLPPPTPGVDPAIAATTSPYVVVDCVRRGAGQRSPRDDTGVSCSSCAIELKCCQCQHCRWATCFPVPTLVKNPVCPGCGAADPFVDWVVRPAAVARLASELSQDGRPVAGARPPARDGSHRQRASLARARCSMHVAIPS
jgi:hypothetical protein